MIVRTKTKGSLCSKPTTDSEDTGRAMCTFADPSEIPNAQGGSAKSGQSGLFRMDDLERKAKKYMFSLSVEVFLLPFQTASFSTHTAKAANIYILAQHRSKNGLDNNTWHLPEGCRAAVQDQRRAGCQQ